MSSIGYAVSETVTKSTRQRQGLGGGFLKGLKKREAAEEVLTGEDKSAKIIGLVRRAMLGRLTIPCDYTTAERALVLIAGPPNEMDRKGVEKSKSWVEENIAGVEVRGGDYPTESSKIAAVVVLATIGDAPRIRELMDIAKETKEDVIKSKERRSSMFDGDEIDPLFE